MPLSEIGKLTLGQYHNFIKQAGKIMELQSGGGDEKSPSSDVVYGKRPSQKERMDWNKVRDAARLARAKGIM